MAGTHAALAAGHLPSAQATRDAYTHPLDRGILLYQPLQAQDAEREGFSMTGWARPLGIAGAVLAMTGATTLSPRATEIVGPAVILDGDTIRIGQTRIRFLGIDAPETDQSCLDQAGKHWLCGIAARDAVSRFIAARPVRCEGSSLDVYGRVLATCWVATENINRWLVHEGLALAYVKYSREFVEEEKAARDARRGMWAGAFIAPWDWRTRTPVSILLGRPPPGASPQALFSPQESPPDPACPIKGNVNRNGERIFHIPGQRDYARVTMKSTAKRWFCSEDEALAAGWRKAKR